MPAAHQQPIIIIKKKGGHGRHHGGAWKVAYADFVTAMMALFIVLWLMNSSPNVKKAVSGYFKDPSGNANKTGSSLAGVGEGVTITKDNMEQLKNKLEQEIKKTPEFQKLRDHVEMTITNEGLRIELLETDKGMFFESGSPVPTNTGKDLLIQLAKQLGPMKNPLLMEGHTDSQPYGSSTYTNWELSADRANAARRIMQASGLQTTQVTQVRGFADQHLRLAKKPADPSNRRISIVVQYPNSELAQLLGARER
jgi:chemotaxis protein MotB